jgi:hypothetical protein
MAGGDNRPRFLIDRAGSGIWRAESVKATGEFIPSNKQATKLAKACHGEGAISEFVWY